MAKVNRFNVSIVYGTSGINEKLKKLGIDADDVISIQLSSGVFTVWYKER